MIYADTDSSKELKTKLNSLYGTAVMYNKDYIVVHRDNRPIIIFKKYITAIERCDDDTAVIYTVDSTYYADEKYVDVVKRII